MKHLRSLFPTVVLAAGLNLAAAQDLDAFLAPVTDHPGLAATAAQLVLEEARLAQARDPVTLNLSAGYSAFQAGDSGFDWLPDELADLFAPPESASQLSLGLVLRPIPLGDMADMYDQAVLQYALAELTWRETLTGLQVAAISTAYQLHLAEESLALAREGAALAAAALEATGVRFDNGAATDRELRDARAGAAEAEALVASASAGVELARLALHGLVGTAEPPPREQLRLGLPTGEAASVQRAALQAELTTVGARNARRSVLPVVQTSYTRFLDEQNSLGVSLESRTLQPTISYDWQSTARSFPETMIEGSFTIGVSASISPAVTAALRAAQAQEDAGGHALDAARQQAETERSALVNDLTAAERELDLADLLYRNAQSSLTEAEEREALGLSIPLETQQAALALMRAELDLQAARQQHLERTLAFYEFTARPLSEVEPR